MVAAFSNLCDLVAVDVSAPGDHEQSGFRRTMKYPHSVIALRSRSRLSMRLGGAFFCNVETGSNDMTCSDCNDTPCSVHIACSDMACNDMASVQLAGYGR